MSCPNNCFIRPPPFVSPRPQLGARGARFDVFHGHERNGSTQPKCWSKGVAGDPTRALHNSRCTSGRSTQASARRVSRHRQLARARTTVCANSWHAFELTDCVVVRQDGLHCVREARGGRSCLLSLFWRRRRISSRSRDADLLQSENVWALLGDDRFEGLTRTNGGKSAKCTFVP